MIGDKLIWAAGVFIGMSSWFVPSMAMGFCLLVGGCLIVVGTAIKIDRGE